MKKKLYCIILILLVIAIGNVVYAKYILNRNFELKITTEPFYFDATMEEENIAFTENKASFYITLKNYVDETYNNYDVDYEIDLEDESSLSISIEDENNQILKGGNVKENRIKINLELLEDVTPETINLNIKSITPYEKEIILPVKLKQLATGIAVNPATVTISNGETTTLTATITPDTTTDKTVIWTSSNTSVATVDNNGVVTGIAAGTATITATTNDGSNKSATSTVTVKQLATGISVTPTTASILTGESTTLTATITPSTTSNKKVTWTSSNTSVATVNSSGVVTGIASGTATITATTTDGTNKTASCTVTVRQKAIITNMVVNGSFENGLNNWTIVTPNSGGTWGTAAIPYHGSMCAYRYPSKVYYNYLSQNIYWTQGHTYYFFVYGISVTEQTLACDVYLKGGSINVTTNPYGYTKGSSLFTPDFTGNNAISVNFEETTDNINIDGVGIVDLTAAFGAGKEPDKAWCDANINYFEGSMTVYK